jgi:hypothetical protein
MKYYYDDKMRDYEVGRALKCMGKNQKYLQTFVRKSKDKRSFEDVGVDGRMLLKWILRILRSCGLGMNRGQWWNHGNTVLKLS